MLVSHRHWAPLSFTTSYDIISLDIETHTYADRAVFDIHLTRRIFGPKFLYISMKRKIQIKHFKGFFLFKV